jgi:hypothetical protein
MLSRLWGVWGRVRADANEAVPRGDRALSGIDSDIVEAGPADSWHFRG